MSIKDKFEKIKQFLDGDRGKAFYMTLLIILVAISSFGLGRLSKIALNDDQVVIGYEAQNLVANTQQGLSNEAGEAKGNSSTGLFVASKKGKKYYPIDCSAGSSLKEENKIFFETEAEAEADGYTKSNSC